MPPPDAEPIRSAATTAGPARQARDRLIAALLAPRSDGVRLMLCAWEPDVALLVDADERLRIVLRTVDAGALPRLLRDWVARVVSLTHIDGTELHLVAVGGGDEVATALKRARPKQNPTPIGFHHLDASGRLTRVATHNAARELPLLAEAVARTDIEAPTPERLAAALAEGRAQLEAAVKTRAALRGSYRVTAALTAACVVMMALELLWMSAGEIAVFTAMGANSGDLVAAGEVWRLLASAFLHGSVIHLLLNMLALWSFGGLLEALLGPRRYLLLYGLSALGGSLASAFLGSAPCSVGASGAIWGLMTAGLGIAYWPRDLLPPAVVAQLRKRAWMPLLLNLGYSFQPGIDLLAHLGGGVVGFALIAGVLTRGLKPVAEREHPADIERAATPAVRAGAVAMGLAMALSVGVALASGRPWQLGAPLVYQRTAIGDTGISVEMPDRIAAHPIVEGSPGARLFAFGRFPQSPVVFEFLVVALPHEITPTEADPLLEQERLALDTLAPENFKRVAPAERISLGGHPAMAVEYRLNDLSLKTYVLALRRHILLMRRYVLGATPRTWVGAEEKIAASIAEP